MKLRFRQKWQARQAARQCWMTCEGDAAKAEAMFRGMPEYASLDPATIMAILQIALMLWKWWKETNTSEPSLVAHHDEPWMLEGADDAE